MPRISKILTAIGIILVVGSVVLLAVSWIMTGMAQDKAESIVQKLCEVLPERSDGITDRFSDMNMPVLEIDGEDFIALIEVPEFDVILPVGNEWDSSVVSAYPGRIMGSVYDGSLMIGGNDQTAQFDFFRKIEIGTNVIVTDMTGAEFSYSVYRVKISGSADIGPDDYLIENPDLILYTMDAYSGEYIEVFCNTD